MAALPFDGERFLALKRQRSLRLGEPLTLAATTASTNDDALNAARSDAPHGALFVADEQTQGRGRRGNSWFSPPYENLTFSLLLRPKLPATSASGITLALGLAVRDALATRVRTPVGIKWPNDIVAGRKKLGGLLVESQLQGTNLSALVVGVGLNVSTKVFPAELAAIATSLAALGCTDLSRESLLADVLQAVDARVRAYEVDGLRGMLDELRGHDALWGCRVKVDGSTGTARGISEDGALLLQADGDKDVRTILSGTIERL